MLTKEASYQGQAIGRSVLRCFLLLSIVALGVTVSQSAIAQTTSVDQPVYTYVEQMPELPGGGGNAAIIAAIQKRLKVPTLCPPPDWPRTMAYFVVGKDGAVYGEKITVSSGVSHYDAALLDAIRALPRLKPGRQANKPVAVSFTVPISIRIQY